MKSYLDSIRADANDSSVIDAMLLVDEGVYPVEWVRDALTEGLRNRAKHWRQISGTSNYRFTEGRSAGHYIWVAQQDEELASVVETGKEIVYASHRIPAAA